MPRDGYRMRGKAGEPTQDGLTRHGLFFESHDESAANEDMLRRGSARLYVNVIYARHRASPTVAAMPQKGDNAGEIDISGASVLSA